ncbi:hypothetical protein ACS0TY_014288 [Phlomoides rotata]
MPGLVHGFLYNLCTAVTSCFYVFCCCWLLEDCCMGRRSFPGPPYGYGSLDPPPPDVGPRCHGLIGSIFGGPLGPSPPPPFGPRYQHQHHGLMGSNFDDPMGPSQPPPLPNVGPQYQHQHHGLFG